MAARRLLSQVFQERKLFRTAQNSLLGNGSALYADIVEFQRFDPWFLQRRGVVMPAQSRACPFLLNGDGWREELKNLNNAVRDRLHQEVVGPLEGKKSAEEERRLLRLVQTDSLMKRLGQIPHACISLKELLQTSNDCAGKEHAKEVVKLLDEAEKILIVGDRVYLRPEQVARAFESVLPLLDDRRREELQEMEKQKDEIDLEAEKLVHKELWCGFGFMALQTAALMRFTFWDLSWDVMEPMCFYLTSIYFLAGYAFFLRTSTDPTFEGFFQARFKTWQKRLIENRNFDIQRFKELRMITKPSLRQSASRGLLDAI